MLDMERGRTIAKHKSNNIPIVIAYQIIADTSAGVMELHQTQIKRILQTIAKQIIADTSGSVMELQIISCSGPVNMQIHRVN